MMKKNATINDVAKRAHVSPKTVSNYLNQTAPVNQNTAKRIADAITDLQYVPNMTARKFRTGTTFIIGLVLELESLNQPVTYQMQYELQKTLAKSKYALEVIVVDSKDGPHFIDTRLMDGLLVGTAGKKLFEHLKDLLIPVVYLRRVNAINCSSIVINDYEGGKIAANYLVDNNHKKIGVIRNFSNIVGDDFVLRRKGFVDALGERGIQPQVEFSIPVETDNLQQWLVQNLNKLLEHDVTAYFVTTDVTAINVISSLHKIGIHVPEDISIISFDNIFYSSLFIPPLTTVGGFYSRICQLAAQHIIEKIEDNENENLHIIIEPKLFKRESVKRL